MKTIPQKVFASIREKYPRWRRATDLFSNRLAELAVVFGVAVTLEYGLLFFGRGFWAVYVETQVGQVFLQQNTQMTATIRSLLAADLPSLAFNISLFSLGVLILVGLAAQLLLVLRCAYYSRGLVGRVLLWGLPLAALSAHHSGAAIHSGWTVAILVALVPTLVLMPSTFALAANTLPELDDLCRPLFDRVHRLVKRRHSCESEPEDEPTESPEAPAAPVEPDVIPLEPDPARPGVSMALCAKCRQKVVYPSKFAGRRVKCRGCGSSFALPVLSAQAAVN